MKRIIITLGAVSLLLMLSCCNHKNTVERISPNEDGSLTLRIGTLELELDEADAAEYTNDDPAPDDKLHTKEYITQRVKSFYELMDDGKCCSENYLKLRKQAEQTAANRGTNLKEETGLKENHWTLAQFESDGNEDWSYEVLGVGVITKNRALVLVDINQHFGSKIKLHLVLERGDWYVDNFDIWMETGFDATVEVYEEMEVYYNEKEMMQKFIQAQ